MSYPVLSSSVNWKLESYKKTPVFNSSVQKNAAMRGISAASMMPFPSWDFQVELPANKSSILTTSSIISQFLGVFGACQGRGGLFLFNDATDNSVSLTVGGMLDVTPGSANPMSATGNGTSTNFQLARTLGGLSWDMIQNLNGSIVVEVNGTTTVPASISSTGVVTFTSAPAGSAALTWSGNFYFLCRFAEDSFKELSMIGYNASGPLWQCGGISFSSEFL